ncbi:MAG TPA: hypothetical protein VN369_08635, partial [Terriglobales bacterium]|nr:hypothetical protein [Terriglobales bacterium]
IWDPRPTCAVNKLTDDNGFWLFVAGKTWPIWQNAIPPFFFCLLFPVCAKPRRSAKTEKSGAINSRRTDGLGSADCH